ncbi:hypothetical protein I204_01703 [Kwoniella mangroviensis CBS 8886]|uniref:uncharacterized protein n=1 Tax=Kwoniella mangroviensis CBS 8507 TaxID=1296122 RepID=UPI00080D75D0|nr:uncharacterized protein I203_03993 [Kwoniella mangroviensis CBS 8507]OCF67303.1 hypothetical protein I203_03993 [Kwoniella mangroviensis CBS 8507]OCF77705.1 hypothetical protein I204_01703 [Kwoniella mangroviensis CBS 8886]
MGVWVNIRGNPAWACREPTCESQQPYTNGKFTATCATHPRGLVVRAQYPNQPLDWYCASGCGSTTGNSQPRYDPSGHVSALRYAPSTRVPGSVSEYSVEYPHQQQGPSAGNDGYDVTFYSGYGNNPYASYQGQGGR